MNLPGRAWASALVLVLLALALPGCATVDSVLARLGEDAEARPATKTPKPAAMSAKALVGNSEEQVVALLGRPVSVRDEPPAIVWRYEAATSCRIDIFFYFDVASEAFRSLAYKFYPDPRAKPSVGECLTTLRADRQAVQKKRN